MRNINATRQLPSRRAFYRDWLFCTMLMTSGLVTSGMATSGLAHEVGHDPERQRVRPEALYRPTASPDRIVLTWAADPKHSQAVTWRTDVSVTRAVAQFTLADPGPNFPSSAKQVTAATTPLRTDLGEAHYHTAHFTGLQPATKYVYRVGDGVNWSEWSHFNTAAAGAAPFSFVYFGDAQNDVKSMWSRVIRQAYSNAPQASFFLHAGDLVNQANSDAEWGEWFYAAGWINTTTPCVPTPGNHEYDEDDQNKEVEYLTHHWRPQFALPEHGPAGLEETVYYFDYQGVRIISLNSNEKFAEQRLWLDRVLDSNENQWTIITLHHPLYAAKSTRDNTWLRKHWQSTFDKHRVDLVLQGHDHSYARSTLVTATSSTENLTTGVNVRSPEAGTVYVVSVSGPKMYDVEQEPFFRRVAQDTQLYQIVHVEGNRLHYEARTAVGEIYDAFTLRKRPAAVNELIERVPATPERLRLGLPAP